MIVLVEHDISWLKISVDNLVLSKILKGDNDLSYHVFGQDIIETSLSFKEVNKAASGTQLDQQVKFVVIFKRLVEFDD